MNPAWKEAVVKPQGGRFRVKQTTELLETNSDVYSRLAAFTAVQNQIVRMLPQIYAGWKSEWVDVNDAFVPGCRPGSTELLHLRSLLLVTSERPIPRAQRSYWLHPWNGNMLLCSHLFLWASRQQAAGLMRVEMWSVEGSKGRGSKHRKAEEAPIYYSCEENYHQRHSAWDELLISALV